jgi:hypothetical protein
MIRCVIYEVCTGESKCDVMKRKVFVLNYKGVVNRLFQDIRRVSRSR